jgi:hypothetical protein
MSDYSQAVAIVLAAMAFACFCAWLTGLLSERFIIRNAERRALREWNRQWDATSDRVWSAIPVEAIIGSADADATEAAYAAARVTVTGIEVEREIGKRVAITKVGP